MCLSGTRTAKKCDTACVTGLNKATIRTISANAAKIGAYYVISTPFVVNHQSEAGLAIMQSMETCVRLGELQFICKPHHEFKSFKSF
jgi:hypothetical protein